MKHNLFLRLLIGGKLYDELREATIEFHKARFNAIVARVDCDIARYSAVRAMQSQNTETLAGNCTNHRAMYDIH